MEFCSKKRAAFICRLFFNDFINPGLSTKYVFPTNHDRLRDGLYGGLRVGHRGDLHGGLRDRLLE